MMMMIGPKKFSERVWARHDDDDDYCRQFLNEIFSISINNF